MFHLHFRDFSEVVSREDDQSSYSSGEDEDEIGWCHDIVPDDIDLLNLNAIVVNDGIGPAFTV